MPKWTKREINAMTSALVSFVVHHRPVSGFSDNQNTQFEDVFRNAINAKRKDMIVMMLKCDIAIKAEYIAKAHEYLAHAAAHPDVCGEYSVGVTKRELAKDEEFVARTNKLLARIESEPLPDEVTNFDPLRH